MSNSLFPISIYLSIFLFHFFLQILLISLLSVFVLHFSLDFFYFQIFICNFFYFSAFSLFHFILYVYCPNLSIRLVIVSHISLSLFISTFLSVLLPTFHFILFPTFLSLILLQIFHSQISFLSILFTHKFTRLISHFPFSNSISCPTASLTTAVIVTHKSRFDRTSKKMYISLSLIH